MKRTNRTFLIAVAVLLAASACITTLPAPATAPPAASPNLAGTQRAGTLTASVPTALPSATRLIPTLTPSMTMTFFPSITPLPTATATYTETPFGFVPTKTPLPPTIAISPTFSPTDIVDGRTDDYGSDYRCTLISKTPANWTVVPAQQKYKVSWTLLNSGKKKWQVDQMTLTFVEGARLEKESPYLLVRDVKVNQTITPVVNIYPPKTPGTYKSVWGLRTNKDSHLFCTFTVQITVKK